jgi:hypothetical protein
MANGDSDRRPHPWRLALPIVGVTMALVVGCGGSSGGNELSGGQPAEPPSAGAFPEEWTYSAEKDGKHLLVAWRTSWHEGVGQVYQGEYSLYTMSTTRPISMVCVVYHEFGGTQDLSTIEFDNGLRNGPVSGTFEGDHLTLSKELGPGVTVFTKTDRGTFDGRVTRPGEQEPPECPGQRDT